MVDAAFSRLAKKMSDDENEAFYTHTSSSQDSIMFSVYFLKTPISQLRTSDLNYKVTGLDSCSFRCDVTTSQPVIAILIHPNFAVLFL